MARPITIKGRITRWKKNEGLLQPCTDDDKGDLFAFVQFLFDCGVKAATNNYLPTPDDHCQRLANDINPPITPGRYFMNNIKLYICDDLNDAKTHDVIASVIEVLWSGTSRLMLGDHFIPRMPSMPYSRYYHIQYLYQYLPIPIPFNMALKSSVKGRGKKPSVWIDVRSVFEQRYVDDKGGFIFTLDNVREHCAIRRDERRLASFGNYFLWFGYNNESSCSHCYKSNHCLRSMDRITAVVRDVRRHDIYFEVPCTRCGKSVSWSPSLLPTRTYGLTFQRCNVNYILSSDYHMLSLATRNRLVNTRKDYIVNSEMQPLHQGKVFEKDILRIAEEMDLPVKVV